MQRREKKESSAEGQSNYIRRGYLIDSEVAKAIKRYGIDLGLKDYQVVNMVLKKSIPDKYFTGD